MQNLPPTPRIPRPQQQQPILALGNAHSNVHSSPRQMSPAQYGEALSQAIVQARKQHSEL